MLHAIRGLLFAALTVALGFWLSGVRADAQPPAKAGETVKITTVDGVDLHGLFFPSPKKDAPTVILLHPLGETGMTKSYTGLAESLQANYSVMCFDFRGHGKSKDIDPLLFRKYRGNERVKGGPMKATVEYGDFPKDYYPILCNDIAAVKAYLDRKNDVGACNTSSTILIGAETGATLGAIWLNSQWSLYKLVPNANPLLAPSIANNPEGKDVIACVWLTISPKLGTLDISVSKALQTPVKSNGTASVFIYGDADVSGKSLAHAVVDKLKDGKNPKHEYVRAYGVKGNTKLKGMKLLSTDLSTKDDIIDYLKVVVDKKGAESVKRDFRNTEFVWQNYPGPPQAKTRLVDMNNFHFETYLQFYSR
jgi:hypothetical protein